MLVVSTARGTFFQSSCSKSSQNAGRRDIFLRLISSRQAEYEHKQEYEHESANAYM